MPEVVPFATIPGGKYDAVLVVAVGGGVILRLGHDEKTEIEIERKHHGGALPFFYASTPLRSRYGGLKRSLDELRREPYGNASGR
jgi:hypothetical protein